MEGLILKLKLQYFGYLMQRANSLEKTLMLGNIECRRRRGRQDEMVGWHHRLNGHGFGWTPGVGDGQGGLACYGSWGRKELDMTERLNSNNCSDLVSRKGSSGRRTLGGGQPPQPFPHPLALCPLVCLCPPTQQVLPAAVGVGRPWWEPVSQPSGSFLPS